MSDSLQANQDYDIDVKREKEAISTLTFSEHVIEELNACDSVEKLKREGIIRKTKVIKKILPFIMDWVDEKVKNLVGETIQKPQMKKAFLRNEGSGSHFTIRATLLFLRSSLVTKCFRFARSSRVGMHSLNLGSHFCS